MEGTKKKNCAEWTWSTSYQVRAHINCQNYAKFHFMFDSCEDPSEGENLKKHSFDNFD